MSSDIHNILLQSLEAAITVAASPALSTILALTNDRIFFTENQKGTIEDCNQLHQLTITYLSKSHSRLANTSAPIDKFKLADVSAYLSAALTNKNTCQEGLQSASGRIKPQLVNTIDKVYKPVSISLSLLSNHVNASGSNQKHHVMNNEGMTWLSMKDDYDDYNALTVAADGSGNFTTITDAINFAPNNSFVWVIIKIKQGLYEENVEIPSYKTNIVLLGEGSDATVISGSRSNGDGWTTFRSATVAVSGEGFLARDIRFENVAGPEKNQAVALRINANYAAVYRCSISGYQDTLYAHSLRQFYRECDINGTIDYILGNAFAVFQNCNITSMMPRPGQYTVISAQSRYSIDILTGFSFQNCSVKATDDLKNSPEVKNYLGRPWRKYSRTAFIKSYIDGFIDHKGWIEWPGNEGLDTLYYGEYENVGPGSDVSGRVTWDGFHVMDAYEASKFSVSELITGQEWLDSTLVPYNDGV